MNVYLLVEHIEYSPGLLQGIFSTNELAQAAKQTALSKHPNDNISVHEIELDKSYVNLNDWIYL